MNSSKSPVKMLFIIPSSTSAGQTLRPSHHPITSLTLAAVARENGAIVKFIDAGVSGHSHQDICHYIQNFEPDLIGINPFEYRRELDLQHSFALVSYIKNTIKTPKIGILNSPVHNSSSFDQSDVDIDFIFWGDSEAAVKHFIHHRDFECEGVTLIQKEHSLTQAKATVIDWSIVTTPAWDLCDISRYIPSAHRYLELPVLPVMTSRSCPYGCDFCPHSLFHTAEEYTNRPVDDILKEIKDLIDIYNVANIEFYDPTFGVNKTHLLSLCTGLQKLNQTQQTKLQWSCYSRCDLLSKDTLQKMKDAGCHTILFGVESGNKDVLKRTQKHLQLDDVELFIRNCKEIGIQTIASFIIGLPLDTPQTIKQTIEFACEVDPTFAQFHPARSFSESTPWVEFGDFGNDWDETSSSINGRSFIPEGFDTNKLYYYLFLSYVKFYARPQKIKGMIGTIDSRSDIKRYLFGGMQILQLGRELYQTRK